MISNNQIKNRVSKFLELSYQNLTNEIKIISQTIFATNEGNKNIWCNNNHSTFLLETFYKTFSEIFDEIENIHLYHHGVNSFIEIRSKTIPKFCHISVYDYNKNKIICDENQSYTFPEFVKRFTNLDNEKIYNVIEKGILRLL